MKADTLVVYLKAEKRFKVNLGKMDIAVLKAINKEYLNAIECYERELTNHYSALPEYYINLAFLYWEFAFQLFEFNIPNNIPGEWSLIGGERYSKIIDMGIAQYPGNTELHFWKKYFQEYLLAFENFSQKDCEELVNNFEKKSLVPYFYLYLFDKVKYKKERDELLLECKSMPTAKNLYIEVFLK